MRTLICKVCLFACLCVAAAGCLKNDTPQQTTCTPVTVATVAPDSEVVKLKAYLDSNHIIAHQDGRGFFYTIDTTVAPDSAHATSCSSIAVTYKGTLLNGMPFDTSSVVNIATFYLGDNLITGWKEAIPLMRKGASMVLYLPPSLAYGASGSGPIPPNSSLIFYIKLYDYTK